MTGSLSHLFWQIPTSNPAQLVSGPGVFETQITSDYKAIGYETVFPLSKWIQFIKDKGPSYAVAKGMLSEAPGNGGGLASRKTS